MKRKERGNTAVAEPPAVRPPVVSASHTRPVAGMMDRLGHLSFEELITEKRRLEKARRGPGIGPDDWYRLHAVKALLTRYEVENLRGPSSPTESSN